MGKHELLAIASAAAFASSASAATLTVSPDAFTYQVGDRITLIVLGDPEGEASNVVFGRLLYPAERASFLEANQQTLTTSFGSPWTVAGLDAGIDAEGLGFADAFAQVDGQVGTPSNALVATVVLLAESAGVLAFDWQTEGRDSLDFFSLDDAPGGSVLIIPEPATLALVAVGAAVGFSVRSRRRRFER